MQEICEQVINGNLAVSRVQQAEWQVQEALFTSKLKTRKRGEILF